MIATTDIGVSGVADVILYAGDEGALTFCLKDIHGQVMVEVTAYEVESTFRIAKNYTEAHDENLPVLKVGFDELLSVAKVAKKEGVK